MEVRASPEGCLFDVKVQPRSRERGVSVTAEGILKVSVPDPPHDGKANAACIECIADILGIPRSRVEITRGHKSRIKTIKVTGMTPGEVREIIENLGHRSK